MDAIGHHVLSHRIGAGGMAEVWLARRAKLGTNKPLALKRLAPHLAHEPRYRAMFLAEARLSMCLNHANIVQTFDVGETSGEYWMAMEWVDGANLAEVEAALWAADRGMPIDLAMYIIGEVLRALDYAHNLTLADAATVVHRDVSPANILLSRAGQVKLTDFGVARFGSDETSGLHVKGKLRYMAPEQLEGRSRTGSVDLYAVGAVLHELLDGGKFRGRDLDEAQLVGRLVAGDIPSLREPHRVSAQLDALRRDLLNPDPDARVASARAALHRLQRCPGYRDASHELEALVHWVAGPEPSHSSQVARVCVDTDPATPATTSVQAFDRATSSPGFDRATSSPGFDRATSSPGFEPIPTSSPRLDRRPPPLAIGLALLGLAIGGLGLGAAAHAPKADADPQPRRAPIVADPPQYPITAPDTAAIIVPTAPAQPASSAVPEPPIVEHPPAKPAPARVREPPVPVEFVAGSFQFAYVKVAGRQLVIEPASAVELTPGRHHVQVRRHEQEPWSSFGYLRVRAGHAHRVKLTAPHGLEVEVVRSP